MNTTVDLFAIYYMEDIPFGEESTGTIRRDFDYISQKWAGKAGQVLLPSFCIDDAGATDDDLTLSLAEMKLIDTSKATWNQIMEFREDEAAKKRVRNLRLFFHQNYQGKSRSYIEDDLAKRLDEYYDACKDWGFETVTFLLSAVMDSKNVISLLAGSAYGILFGGTAGGIISGAAIEIANISLHLAKRMHAFNKLRKTHELAFIIEAREKLQ